MLHLSKQSGFDCHDIMSLQSGDFSVNGKTGTGRQTFTNRLTILVRLQLLCAQCGKNFVGRWKVTKTIDIMTP